MNRILPFLMFKVEFRPVELCTMFILKLHKRAVIMKKYFEFEKSWNELRREIIGGVTTFLAMAYILAVNPIMLSLEGIPDLPDAMRMDKGAVFVATALAAAVGSLFMGIDCKIPNWLWLQEWD